MGFSCLAVGEEFVSIRVKLMFLSVVARTKCCWFRSDSLTSSRSRAYEKQRRVCFLSGVYHALLQAPSRPIITNHQRVQLPCFAQSATHTHALPSCGPSQETPQGTCHDTMCSLSRESVDDALSSVHRSSELAPHRRRKMADSSRGVGMAGEGKWEVRGGYTADSRWVETMKLDSLRPSQLGVCTGILWRALLGLSLEVVRIGTKMFTSGPSRHSIAQDRRCGSSPGDSSVIVSQTHSGSEKHDKCDSKQ